MTIKTGKYYQNKLKTLQSNNTVTMDLTNKINNNEHTFIWRYRKLNLFLQETMATWHYKVSLITFVNILRLDIHLKSPLSKNPMGI